MAERYIPAIQMDLKGQKGMLDAVHAYMGEDYEADIIAQLAYVKPAELSDDRFRRYEEALDQNVAVADTGRKRRDDIHALWVPENELAQSALVIVTRDYRLGDRDVVGMRRIDQIAQNAIWLTDGKAKFDGWQFTPHRTLDFTNYD